MVYAPWGKFRIAGVGNGHDYRNFHPCTDGVSTTYPHTTYSGVFVSWSFEWSGNEGVLRGGAPGSSGNPDIFLDL